MKKAKKKAAAKSAPAKKPGLKAIEGAKVAIVAPAPMKLESNAKKPGRLEHAALDTIVVIRNPRQRPVSAEEQAAFEDSIATQGVLEPVLVRPLPKGMPGKGKYELLAGGRRFAAAKKKLGSGYKIPVHIKDVDDLEARLIALAENSARSDMHPLDEAQEFVALVAMGAKVADLAERAGKSDRYVQKRMKIVEGLDKKGRDALASGKLNVTQAIALAEIADKDVQAGLLDRIIEANRHGYGIEEYDAESIKREAKWAIEQKKAEAERKKNPPKPAPAPKRSHQKKIEYPKPGINGLYARPGKSSRFGYTHDWFKGAVLTITVCELEIGRGQRISGYAYQAGNIEVAEPLTTKMKPEPYVDHDAVAARALERVIADELVPTLKPDFGERLGFDLIAAVAELRSQGCGKEAEAIEKKLRPKLHVSTTPLPRPPAADELATAPRTHDAMPKSASAEDITMPKHGGVALVRAHRHSKFPNKAAVAADVPDEVVIEKNGRFFHYRYGGEIFPEANAAAAAGKTPIEAAIDGKPAAAKPKQDDLEIPAFMKRTAPPAPSKPATEQAK